MSRMTVTLDDELITEAQESLGTRTKSETIRQALEEIVRRKRLERVLEHAGQIDLDLDQERLERLRSEG